MDDDKKFEFVKGPINGITWFGVYVCGVAQKVKDIGVAGYGGFWGKGSTWNAFGPVTVPSGHKQTDALGDLTAVLEVLKKAESEGKFHIIVYSAQEYVVNVLNDTTEAAEEDLDLVGDIKNFISDKNIQVQFKKADIDYGKDQACVLAMLGRDGPETIMYHIENGKKFQYKVIDGVQYTVVYTDGACCGQNTHYARAGYGVYFGDDHYSIGDDGLNKSGRVLEGRQTNIRGELNGVLVAIQQHSHLPAYDATGEKRLLVITDLQHIPDTFEKYIVSYKLNDFIRIHNKSPVKNRDLIDKIYGLMKDVDVKFEHVMGHSGNEGNEKADKLAKKGSRELFLSWDRESKLIDWKNESPVTVHIATRKCDKGVALSVFFPTNQARNVTKSASHVSGNKYCAEIEAVDVALKQILEMEKYGEIIPSKNRVIIRHQNKGVVDACGRHTIYEWSDNWKTSSGDPVAWEDNWKSILISIKALRENEIRYHFDWDPQLVLSGGDAEAQSLADNFIGIAPTHDDILHDILSRSYQNSKTSIPSNSYWHSDHISTGPVTIDCEFVEDTDKRDRLARVSIVGERGTVYDTFVAVPHNEVKEYRYEFSGITKEKIKNAPDFLTVQFEVAALIRGRVVIGHGMHNDFEVLQLQHPDSLRRDTSNCMILKKMAEFTGLGFLQYLYDGTVSYEELVESPADTKVNSLVLTVLTTEFRELPPVDKHKKIKSITKSWSNVQTEAMKLYLKEINTLAGEQGLPAQGPISLTPKLKFLAKKILTKDIQEGTHSSVDDALATRDLYMLIKTEWEADIEKAKPKPKKPKIKKTKKEKKANRVAQQPQNQ